MRKALAYGSCFALTAFGLLFLSRGGAAQDSNQKDSSQKDNSSQKDKKSKASAKQETIAKPKTAKAQRADEKRLAKELETPYKKWLNEEVYWIITPEERSAFSRLNTDDERESFIENFWLQRDPTPDTEENEYREEYYRRIAYANETFASGIPGWKTDRGMIYIKYGAPDQRDEHPTGGTYERPIEEGGGETTVYPFEDWRYRYLPGLGNDVNIEFVDPSGTGEYHMTADPSEKDALLYVPGAGLTMYEQLGLACKQDRFTRTDGTHLGTGTMPLPASMNQFDRLTQFANLQKAPETKYKDLQDEKITTAIKYNLLPLQVRADYIPVTDSTAIANITIQFDRKDLSWKDKQGVSSAYVEVNGNVRNLADKRITSFDHDLRPPSIPSEMLEQAARGPDIFQTSMQLKPGVYKLTVTAKDENSGNENKIPIRLDVPHLDDDRLTASSLILSDDVEVVDRHSLGTGKEMFVIGEDKVRPRMNGADGRPNFKKADNQMFIYWRLYNFEPDLTKDAAGALKKADGSVTYELMKDDPKGAVAPVEIAKFSESATDIINYSKSSAAVMVVKKHLDLAGIEPGQYTLKMTAKDDKRNQSVTDSAHFTVN